MSTLNVPELTDEIKNVTTQILRKDVTSVSGFAERQVEAIAHQAELVAGGIASGGITPATREFFLESLGDMVRNFVKTLVGLALVTVEKVWNAIVGVIWGAIGKAVGLALPIPA